MKGDRTRGHVYEAPNELDPSDERARLFLAGSCGADWRSQIIPLLWDLPLAIFNPLRMDFSGDIQKQTEWEFRYCNKANIIAFWLCGPSSCPNSLHELGIWSAWKGYRGHKQIFVGVSPDYPEKQAVEARVLLTRSDVQVVYSLDDLVMAIREYAE